MPPDFNKHPLEAKMAPVENHCPRPQKTTWAERKIHVGFSWSPGGESRAWQWAGVITNRKSALAQCRRVRTSSHTPRGCGLDSGHIPTLWVPSPVEARAGGISLMVFSHIGVSLSLSLSPPLPLSLKSIKNISSDEGQKKKERKVGSGSHL